MLGRQPPLGRQSPLPMAVTAADGTHPTGMHSCTVKVTSSVRTIIRYNQHINEPLFFIIERRIEIPE